jgi:hypothetical protein
MVYLLHFAAPLGNERKQAQHYIGTAENVGARLALHRGGRGAKITAAAAERGIAFDVVRVWVGGRDVERWLKRRKEAHCLCPVCSGTAAWRRAVVLPPSAEQLTLPLEEPAPWELDGYTPPSGGMDWYEAQWMRHCRPAERAPLPADWDAGLL